MQSRKQRQKCKRNGSSLDYTATANNDTYWEFSFHIQKIYICLVIYAIPSSHSHSLENKDKRNLHFVVVDVFHWPLLVLFVIVWATLRTQHNKTPPPARTALHSGGFFLKTVPEFVPMLSQKLFPIVWVTLRPQNNKTPTWLMQLFPRTEIRIRQGPSVDVFIRNKHS